VTAGPTPVLLVPPRCTDLAGYFAAIGEAAGRAPGARVPQPLHACRGIPVDSLGRAAGERGQRTPPESPDRLLDELARYPGGHLRRVGPATWPWPARWARRVPAACGWPTWPRRRASAPGAGDAAAQRDLAAQHLAVRAERRGPAEAHARRGGRDIAGLPDLLSPDDRAAPGLAVPPFADDPDDLIGLGVAAEQAGFEGFFLWDHLVWSDTGGVVPPILDPWQILAVVARPDVADPPRHHDHPGARRRPWQLAKETVTLDRSAAGGSSSGWAWARRLRGLRHLPRAGLGPGERAARWTRPGGEWPGCGPGERFSTRARTSHLTRSGSARWPVQQPRIPVCRRGAARRGPVRRACRWDGMVPLRRSVSPQGDVTLVGPTRRTSPRSRDQAWFCPGYARGLRPGGVGELEREPGDVDLVAPAYVAAGATWWIGVPARDRLQAGGRQRRVSRGL